MKPRGGLALGGERKGVDETDETGGQAERVVSAPTSSHSGGLMMIEAVEEVISEDSDVVRHAYSRCFVRAIMATRNTLPRLALLECTLPCHHNHARPISLSTHVPSLTHFDHASHCHPPLSPSVAIELGRRLSSIGAVWCQGPQARR